MSQLRKDFVKLMEEVVAIRMELNTLTTRQSYYAKTAVLLAIKAELKEVEVNLKACMLGIMLTVVMLNFGACQIFCVAGVMK